MLVAEWKPGYWTPARVEAVCDMGDGETLLEHSKNLAARSPANLPLLSDSDMPLRDLPQHLAVLTDALNASREYDELNAAAGVVIRRERVRRFAERLRGA